MRSLRDYQLEAVEAINDSWAGGVLRPAVVLATGLGKTDIIAAQAAARVRAGRRVLVLAHRFALMRQIVDRCRMHLSDEPATVAGIVAGDLDQRNRPIVAGMVPTLRSKGRRARFAQFRPGDLIIVDECHHAGAKSYVDIMEWAGCYDESSGVSTFGVTATMYESGRKHRGLGDVWQKTVFERDIVWAVNHGPDPADPLRSVPAAEAVDGLGWLAKPRGLAVVVDHLDLSKVKTKGGDYAEDQLGELVAQDADQIADAWLTHGENRQTVGFWPTRESVLAQREAFTRRGVSCEVVLGDTPEAQRGDVAAGTGIYGRLAAGDTRIMLGLMVPTEGWDCPPVSCVLWARPTKISGLYTQGVGRGLRRWSGKRDCLLLDVVGASRTLKLVGAADLMPGIEYAETAPRPCQRCGKFKQPVERFEPKCVCPPLERDPDGGRVRLIGPARYEPVDLFGEAVEDSGEVLWLKTRGGIAFVPAKDRIGCLFPADGMPGRWKAGHVARDNHRDGDRLIQGATLEQAKAAVEEWARGYCEPTYWSRNAPWRRKAEPGTEGQIRAARAMGIADPERYTRAGLSDQLSIRAASRRLDRR